MPVCMYVCTRGEWMHQGTMSLVCHALFERCIERHCADTADRWSPTRCHGSTEFRPPHRPSSADIGQGPQTPPRRPGAVQTRQRGFGDDAARPSDRAWPTAHGAASLTPANQEQSGSRPSIQPSHRGKGRRPRLPKGGRTRARLCSISHDPAQFEIGARPISSRCRRP